MPDKPEHPRKGNVESDKKLPVASDVEEVGRGQQATGATPEQPDWHERYLRLAADLDNSKKRWAQTYARQAEQGKERLLADFLDVADNLERALANAAADPGALIAGMQTIQRQLQQTLAKHGVRPFSVEGQSFDPQRHEAVSVFEQPNLPPNTVAHVVRTGYTMDDKLLRPARVVVTGE